LINNQYTDPEEMIKQSTHKKNSLWVVKKILRLLQIFSRQARLEKPFFSLGMKRLLSLTAGLLLSLNGFPAFADEITVYQKTVELELESCRKSHREEELV